jgi:hypothetical protein
MARECVVFLVGACFLLGRSVAPLRAETKDLKIEQSWDGIIANEKLLKEAPANGKPLQGAAGFVTERKAWVKLWKAWRGKEKVPQVDFTKDLVLVITLGGPNKISPPVLRLDDKGELEAWAAATLNPADGFCYKLVIIRRQGVKSVNRTALPKDGLSRLMKALEEHKEPRRGSVFPLPQAVKILASEPKQHKGAIGFRGLHTYSTNLNAKKLIEQFGDPDETRTVNITVPGKGTGVVETVRSRMLRYGWLQIYVTAKGEIWYIGRKLK